MEHGAKVVLELVCLLYLKEMSRQICIRHGQPSDRTVGHSGATMRIIFLLAAIAAFSGTSHASHCACATGNVHLRNGPGTSHDVISTLRSHHCLPHDGHYQLSGPYTWLHLNYNGQSVWAANNWLDIQECSSTGQPVNSDVRLPGCPRIVTRAEWGARAPAHPIGDMPDLPVYVFIHHGDSSACFDQHSCERKVRGYQNWHMDGRGWSDIGYNFVVGEDGNAYEARGWSEIGAHTKGYNQVGIAICFIGNFTDHLPNQAALTTVQQLIRCGLENNRISPYYTLKGHRDVGDTTCPGTALYHLIQGWPHYVGHTAMYPNPLVG